MTILKIKSVALQLRKAKIDRSGCCQMAALETSWLVKRYLSTLISVFLTGFRYFSYKVATQLSSRGSVDPIPHPIPSEKFLWYSRESNPVPLGWQSCVLTTTSKRLSNCNNWLIQFLINTIYTFNSVFCIILVFFLFFGI